MSNLIEFPTSAPHAGEAALREQIRRQLGAVVGLYLRQPDALETLQAINELNTAVALMRAHFAMTCDEPV